MKKTLCIAALAFATGPAFAADVGVSVNINQPGLYGRIDLGGFDAPRTVYAQPMYVQRGPQVQPPIYLHVPPGHARNWRRYCGQYGACGQPVYFVQDDWYRNVYQPRYREMHGGPRYDGGGDRRDGRRHEDRHDDRGDRGDRDDHDRGNGRGRDGR